MAKDDLSEVAPLGRLKRRADFLRVAAGRRKAVTPSLVLQAAAAAPDSEGCGVRVGFTASRKVGNAVMRNRARRRLKAVAAELVAKHARAGLDLVLIARPATCTCAFDDLRRDLLQSLKRTKAGRTSGASMSPDATRSNHEVQ